jgi:protein-S-isoprenylcysteine O-methyltransferase Ste14
VNDSNNKAGPSDRRPVATIKLGPLVLAGPSALVALVLFLLAALGLFIYFRPNVRPSMPLLISAVLWLVLMGYWGQVAKNSAPAASSESAASRQVHERLLLLALALLFLKLPWTGYKWLPTSAFVVAAGLGLQVFSLALALWARRRLGRNWSGEISKKVGHELIRSGPYRLVRHPIYTAWLGMYVGTAIVSGELHALIGAAIAIAAYWRKIRLEEQHMCEIFGDDYQAYRRKSWALIPGLL